MVKCCKLCKLDLEVSTVVEKKCPSMNTFRVSSFQALDIQSLPFS